MLEHQKLVLQNVAWNQDLFRKELLKSLSWLNEEEQEQLYIWLSKNFDYYNDIIQEVIELSLVNID